MCISKTCFTFWHWHRANFVISRADDNIFFNHYIWSSPTFVEKKTTTYKQTNAAWPYFWSLFTNFCASGPCIYHATSIWRSLHGVNLKHFSEMYIFSERHTQGRSQPHRPGWAKVPLSSFFLKIWLSFLIFPQTLLIFFLILGRPWLRHWAHHANLKHVSGWHVSRCRDSWHHVIKPRKIAVRNMW